MRTILRLIALSALCLGFFVGCGAGDDGGAGGAGAAGGEGGAGGAGAAGGAGGAGAAGGAGGAGGEGGAGGAGGAGGEGGAGGAGGAGGEGGAGGAGGVVGFHRCEDIVSDAEIIVMDRMGNSLVDGGSIPVVWGSQGAAMTELSIRFAGTGNRFNVSARLYEEAMEDSPLTQLAIDVRANANAVGCDDQEGEAMGWALGLTCDDELDEIGGPPCVPGVTQLEYDQSIEIDDLLGRDVWLAIDVEYDFDGGTTTAEYLIRGSLDL